MAPRAACGAERIPLCRGQQIPQPRRRPGADRPRGPRKYGAGQPGASQYGASQYGASQYGASQYRAVDGPAGHR